MAFSAADIVALIAGAAGSPYSPVGHDEVIKMNYIIALGTLDGQMDDVLAWTTSYTIGVSLSEIKWGFYNTSEPGTKESAYLEFTLHDIAGQTLKQFLRVKQGNTLIYFLGPMSDGAFWMPPVFAMYKPIADNCDLQFSQTQGFTYKFTGMPIGHLSKTKMLACPNKITINGLNDKNEAHGNTFEDYLKEVAWKWNLEIAKDPSKSGEAQIGFTWDPAYADNDAMLKQFPVIVDKEKPKELKRAGTADTKIEPFTIDPNTPIAAAVIDLWQNRFVPTEESKDKGIDKSSLLEVNFVEYKGGKSRLDVKCHRKTITDHVASPFQVCIGTDKVCKGAPYRAQMAAINFRGILNLLAASTLQQAKGSGTMEVTRNGNAETQVTPSTKQDPIPEGDKMQVSEKLSSVSISPGTPVGTNLMYDGWGVLGALLNNYKSAEFTIDIDMPYTYAFTPKTHGGLLTDAIPGKPMGGMGYTDGVDLRFWWYISPECQEVMIVPYVSTNYRITKVIHTIGLNGNTTQVSLSHLNVNK